MAITRVGTAIGPVTSASTLTNVAPLPAGTAVGDLVIAVASVERSTELPTLPAGYTVNLTASQSTVVGATIGWKRLNSSDVATGSVTMTNVSGRRQKLGIVVYRGTNDPVWTLGTPATNVAGQTTLTGPAITPSIADSWLLTVFGISTAVAPLQGRNYTVASGGYTELLDAWSNSTSANGGVYFAERVLTGGAGVSQAALVINDVAGHSSVYVTGGYVLSAASTTPPQLVLSNSYDWAVIDATASIQGASGALTYSISPSVGVTQFATGKFLVPRDTADVVYTVTVSEAGNGTDNTPPITVLKAGAGVTTSEAEMVVSNGTIWL